MSFKIVIPLVVLLVLILGPLIYFNWKNITEDWDKFTELLSKINPLSWILGLGYSLFSFVAVNKFFTSVEPDFFNAFLFSSLILLSLYSLSGEIWEHKYSLGNDVMLGGGEYDYYNGNITPNLIVGLMAVSGFILALRTGSVSGWALLAMVSFLILSVLSFHLPQFIDDKNERLWAIVGVLTVKVVLTGSIMNNYIKKP
tara:strand:+ start:265 stop:861 length:597 start_codon:yes stop_codon:yes gene_type:complete